MAELTRRGLLGLLAGAALDPERLLWKPKRYVEGAPFGRPFPIRVEDISLETFRHRFPWRYVVYDAPALQLYPSPQLGDTLRFQYGDGKPEYRTWDGVGWRLRSC